MRTKTAFKNSFFTVLSYLTSAVLGIVNRKYFLRYLSGEYLGYESLFTGIFTLLSFAELGISDVIATHMYRAVANKDNERMSSLMALYKRIYIMIGCIIALLGLGIMFFLPMLIKGEQSNWGYIRQLYMIQLVATLATYLLSYQRLLLIAHQENYICANIDSVVTIISQIARLLILIYFQNYALYLSVLIFKNVVSNIVIAIVAQKRHPNITKIKPQKLLQQEQRELYGEVRDFAVQRAAKVVNQGSDNVIVSAIRGPKVLGFYSNYTLIFSNINAIVYRIIEPMQSTFGNLIFSKEDESSEKAVQVYNVIVLFSFFIASIILTVLVCSVQPFLVLWIGEQFLLPFSFVVLSAVSLYFACMSYPTYYFRVLARNFGADRNFIILSAIVKVVGSVVLIILFGLQGVVLATILAGIIAWYANASVMSQELIPTPLRGLIKKQVVFFIYALLEAGIVFLLTRFLGTGLLNLLLTVSIAGLASLILKIIFFRKQESFKDGIGYLKQLLIGLFKKSSRQAIDE